MILAQSSQTESDLGGIDFSGIDLRYVRANASELRYAFRVPNRSRGTRPLDPRKARSYARQASDAFYVFLALKPSQDWVTINPDHPDQLMDAQLAQTDAGRVMLEADARLKQSATAAWPKVAARLWPRLTDDGCYTGRMWIAPGQVRVYATKDELYVLSAPLRIHWAYMEYKTRRYGLKPCQNVKAARRNLALIDRFLTPDMERQVNSSPEYADLRRIYVSRICAEWFRQANDPRNALSALVDSGDIAPWRMRTPWRPRMVFDAFVRDLAANRLVKITWAKKGSQFIPLNWAPTGGVNLQDIPIHSVSAAEFEQTSPNRAKAIERSMVAPAAEDGDLWFGVASEAANEHLPSTGRPSAPPQVPHSQLPPSTSPAGGEPDHDRQDGFRPHSPRAVGATALIVGIALLWGLGRAARMTARHLRTTHVRRLSGRKPPMGEGWRESAKRGSRLPTLPPGATDSPTLELERHLADQSDKLALAKQLRVRAEEGDLEALRDLCVLLYQSGMREEAKNMYRRYKSLL